MGQAKLRKLAGTYPDGGHVEDFRVADGQLAITVDVQGEDPSTLIFPSLAVVDLLNQFERAIINRPGRPPYHALVREFAAAFRQGKHSGDDLSAVAVCILWTALNHPQHGKTMRQGVAREMRQKGRAHITWHFSEAGLGIGLSDRFVNLEDAVKHAPRAVAVALSQPADDAETRQ